MLKVIAAGAGMALQDHGRPGYQRYGITEGGAMDRWALSEVNLLTGNSPNTAALEMTAMGGEFTITGKPQLMACSGAQMEITLDGTPVPWRSSFVVKPGQILKLGFARNAIYSYLQCAGGFALTPVMESVSTHTRSRFGGFKGRCIEAGDELPLFATDTPGSLANRQLPKPDYLELETIRVVWGTQASVFGRQVRDALFSNDFSVTTQRDRMGARLATDAGNLAAETGLSGVSDAVLPGDIQVAGDGVATVLLADRQPTGGYPRIATVITADIAAIAQMPTGKSFRFALVTVQEAVDALVQMRNQLESLPARLSRVTRHPEDIPDLLSYNLIDGVVSGQSERP